LIERIAARFGVDPACVVIPGGGCSFANHLAMAALVAPGDDVLIEDPAYELLTSTLEYLGANPVSFPRSPARDWRLDAEEVGHRVTPRTRLVVLTNLHNPSSALASEADVAAVAESAAGAWVLADEAYLQLTFADGAAHTAFRADANIVVTSSLTKAYGLSGLRCGWILAPAKLADRMRRLNDLFGVNPPHVAERLSMVAFDRLGELRARAAAMTRSNRAAYREILGAHPALEQVVFDQGTTVFPRLIHGDGGNFFRLLMNKFETSVVPGAFFGARDHIRIGLGGDPVQTREGLTRVAEALARFDGRSEPV
jgi:aspartate/methionine/tyrosine aminotransferase